MCAIVHRDLTKAEWAEFFADTPFAGKWQPTCSGKDIVGPVGPLAGAVARQALADHRRLRRVAFALGYIGFRRSTDDDVLTAVYHSLQLFALGAHDVEDPSWALSVARFLAPAIAAFAAIQAVYLLLREEMQLLASASSSATTSWSRASAASASASRSHSPRRATASSRSTATRQPGAGRLPGARESPPSPAMRPTRHCCPRAAALRAAPDRHLRRRRGEPRRRRTPPRRAEAATRDQTVLVHLEDLELWRVLQAQMLASPPPAGLRIEFFNVLDAAARRLIERHPPSAARPAGESHVLFVGLDGMGEFALIQVARRSRGEGLRISIAGPEADEQLADLLERHPELAEACTLKPTRSRSARRGSSAASSPATTRGCPTSTAIYVCLPQPTDALAAALMLRSRPETRSAAVVVTLWDRRTAVAQLIRQGGGQLHDVEEFAVLDETLVADVGVLGTNELLARLRHEAYIEWERERGETPATNPSMVPWTSCPSRSRRRTAHSPAGSARSSPPRGARSSRRRSSTSRSARGLQRRRGRGARSRRARPLDERPDRARLAVRAGAKDPVAKTHPLLKPWEELGEVDRERDRGSIRELPGLLARAGFESSAPTAAPGAVPEAAAQRVRAFRPPPRRGRTAAARARAGAARGR